VRRGDFAGAATTLEEGVKLDGDRSAFLVKLGEARLELKQLDAAQSALLDAIKLKPALSMAHYDLGLIYEARGQWRDAVAAYEAEIALSPKLYQPHFNMAKLLSRDGRAAEAVPHFRAAVDRNPAFGTGYLYLAKALLDANDLTGAEQAAKRGLDSKPDAGMVPLGHYVLADVYSRLGREAEAARHIAAGQRAEHPAGGSGRP
jgi:tetratricopeptide (TPR) repeat protein